MFGDDLYTCLLLCVFSYQPLSVLKTVERQRQRLVHMSPDLARQLGLILENLEDGAEKEALNITEEGNSQDVVPKIRSKSKQVRKETVNLAKTGVRRRRARHMQVITENLSFYLFPKVLRF